jgi:Uma2 family endonuclease
MVAREQTYTAADLWALSQHRDYADMRLELIEGTLHIMTPAGGEHGGLALKIGARLYTFIEVHGLGYVTAAETGYILFQDARGRDTVRAPDVGFVAAARLPDGLPQQYIPFAPDLAVEVVSPNDAADDVHHKVQDFLRAGTRLLWVVYPRTRTADVHTSQGAHTLTSADTLDGGEVLPGFSLPLRDLFA